MIFKMWLVKRVVMLNGWFPYTVIPPPATSMLINVSHNNYGVKEFYDLRLLR